MPLTISRRIVQETKKIVRSIIQQKSPAFHFIPSDSFSGRLAIIMDVCSRVQNAQISVLCPTRSELHWIYGHLANRFQSRIVILHSGLSKTQYWEAWNKVQKEIDCIVLSTRRGAFAPFTDLHTIIVDVETESSHKQYDQNPRYHVRTIASMLSHVYQSNLIFTDTVPSLDIYHDTEVTKHIIHGNPRNRSLIQLQRTHQSEKSKIVTNEMIQLMKDETGKTLIFHNRKGLSHYLMCSDCGWVLRCPECNIPAIQQTDRVLYCSKCHRIISPPSRCMNCHNTAIRYFGFGTSKVEQEVRPIFPGKRIVRIDASTEDASIDKYDIIIATERILQLYDISEFSTIIIVHLDSMLSIPEGRSLERTYQLVERAITLGTSNAKILIQTFSPAAPIAQALKDGQYKELYDEELRIRHLLDAPPYSRDIELILRAESVTKLNEMKRKTQKYIDKKIGRLSEIRVLHDDRHAHVMQYGKLSERITLRLLSDNIEADKLRSLLYELPNTIIIDVDPL